MSSNNIAKKASNVLNSGKTVNSSVSSNKGMFSGTAGFVIIILFLLAIAVLIYFISTMINPTSGDSIVLISKPTKTSSVSKPEIMHITGESTPLIYSYSFWINVQNFVVNLGTEKPILSRGSYTPGSTATPNSGYYLSLGSTDNILQFNCYTTENTYVSSSSCTVKNFPLQTWVHVALVVNNRNMDLYVNGQLESSCVMKGLPVAVTTTTPITYIYPESETFQGQLSKMYYYMRQLTSSDVYQLYQYGPL